MLDLRGGIGNQLLSFVNGLILALATQRILVLRPRDLMMNGQYNSFELYDSVTPWMTTEFLISRDIHMKLEDPNTTLVLDYWSKKSVEAIMCSESLTSWELSPEILHLRNAVQDVHLLHANPHYKLHDAFHGLEFFFLRQMQPPRHSPNGSHSPSFLTLHEAEPTI
jgi:hypothetical protein